MPSGKGKLSMVAVSNWAKPRLNRDVIRGPGDLAMSMVQPKVPSAQVALLTPSYDRDFHSCNLLCETIDTYATGHCGHFILIDPSDAALFSALAGPNRFIVTDEDLLPRGALIPLGLRWRGRKYWAAGFKMPVNGWHVQQIRKIAVAASLDIDQVVVIDSDTYLCREVDFSDRNRDAVPLYADPGAVRENRPNHIRWFQSAHALLGYEAPPIPADDFIGHVITWDTASVRSMIARIEVVNGRPWWDALCAIRHFSEYMIYGVTVLNDAALAARHEPTSQSVCQSYWDAEQLDEAAITSMLTSLTQDQYSIAIQSFSPTSRDLIRTVIMAPRLAPGVSL